MKKVTIINAYGDKNIGDAAILNVAIRFLNEAYYNKCRISVLCENTKSFSSFIGSMNESTRPFQLPYGYAIRSNAAKISLLTKSFRLVQIFVGSYSYIIKERVFGKKLPSTGFYSYIAEIRNADSVIGMGGGYLTTNTKVKDYFGLMLTLLPVYIAKLYKKKILFLPMSFGPFASSYQENLAYKALDGTTVIARDYVTLAQLKGIDKKDSIKKFYAPDLALFLKNNKSRKRLKENSNYIIVTAREWFADKWKQNSYEHSLVQLIQSAWKNHGLRTIFVPMARNIIEDDDNRVGRRIRNNLEEKSIIETYNPKSLNELQRMLALARAAVCTRMHSAILSVTVGTPFIAIGYGHKTRGFVESFGISEWHIDINDVSFKVLQEKFEKLLKVSNYNSFIKTMEEKQNEIRKYKVDIIDEIRLAGNV